MVTMSSATSSSAGPWSIPTNSRNNPVTLLTDLEEFIADRRPHGPLTADATEPAWNGDLLTVACPCGVTFERWVTPEDAELDLLRAAALN